VVVLKFTGSFELVISARHTGRGRYPPRARTSAFAGVTGKETLNFKSGYWYLFPIDL